MAESIENIKLRISQQNQIIEQYRVNIYNLELRNNLIVKLLEEKGITAIGEIDRRWPLYLKNDVGVLGADGIMEGSLKVHMYGIGAN